MGKLENIDLEFNNGNKDNYLTFNREHGLNFSSLSLGVVLSYSSWSLGVVFSFGVNLGRFREVGDENTGDRHQRPNSVAN